MNEKEIEVYDKYDSYVKSNFLIASKYKSSLLEAKVLAVSLNKISNLENTKIDREGSIEVTLKAAEIKKLLKLNSGSFYTQLEKVAMAMTGRTIGYSDPELERFSYMAMVTNASYDNGFFTIRFNKDISKYLKNIETNYSVLSISTMLSFKSVYSFRLYELLKSKAYGPKWDKNKKYIKFSISLAELKLILGVVNAELESVKRVLNDTRIPDYEAAIEKSPEKVFETWYELRRNCLEVAKKEMEEKSDLSFTYEPLKSGRGGKVYAVEFVVNRKDIKDKNETDIIATDKSKKDRARDFDEDAFLDNVLDLIPGIRIKDARAIAKAADYNLSVIEEKSEIMLNSGIDKIDNPVGWMIKAIEENFQPVKTKIKVKKAKDNKEKIDYDKLAQELIKID